MDYREHCPQYGGGFSRRTTVARNLSEGWAVLRETADGMVVERFASSRDRAELTGSNNLADLSKLVVGKSTKKATAWLLRVLCDMLSLNPLRFA